MRRSDGLSRILAVAIATTLINPALMPAADNPASWQDLQQLAAGQNIEVTKSDGSRVQGAFVSFADESISLHGKQQEIAIQRSDVSRVQLRRGSRRTWLGAVIGGGAGAGLGTRAPEGGGDFKNLKPAFIGAGAGLGALAGAAIGSVLDQRSATIYVAKKERSHGK